LRALSINSNRPFTIDDSAQPGRSRDDSTSKVCLSLKTVFVM
jgi:hypothetical protein